MTGAESPLTARSSIGDWLDSPVGGPLLGGLLEQGGQDAAALAPVRTFPLQQLVALSRGAMTQDVIDDLVLRANGGTMPEEPEQPAGTHGTIGGADRSGPVRGDDRGRHRRRFGHRPCHGVQGCPRGRPGGGRGCVGQSPR